MIDEEELKATLADQERNAPDVDAVRREIVGVNKSPDRWSGRGPVLLAAAGVAAVAVLTAVVVVGARSSAPAAGPPEPPLTSIAPAPSADWDPSDAPKPTETGSVAFTYPGTATAGVLAPSAPLGPAHGWTIGWDPTSERLLVTLSGSGSCPPRVVSVGLTGPQELTLGVEVPAVGAMCTLDDRPYTSEIVVPEGTVRTEPLTVRVSDYSIEIPVPNRQAGPVTRPFRSADVFGSRDPESVSARGFPLAQWAGDGRLFVTTQGSSGRGCERSITSVERTGPQTITIGTGRVKDGTPVPTTAIVSCSADLAPLTSEIVLPDGIVSTEPLTIVLDDMALELPPAP